MDFVAHETALDRQTDGTTLRAIYTEKARRGDVSAMKALQGPEYPDEVQYLDTWRMELHGRSGVGMNGPAPLSYATIRDWSHLTGNEVTADDVRALLRLDTAMFATEIDTAVEEAPMVKPSWPTKKTDA